MGWWQELLGKLGKNKAPDNNALPTISLTGVIPAYATGFGSDIYASDVVQQAIHSIVTELKKLDPVHVRRTNKTSEFVAVENGDVQRVLENPNPLMTTCEFIEKYSWMLLLNYNAFAYPMWDGNKLVAIYPLQPTEVTFLDYMGKFWVEFKFVNGYQVRLPYEDVIHTRFKFSESEFMGGNREGRPEYAPLLDTLKLNDTLLKGLAKSLNIQTSVNGVVKMKTMMNTADQEAKIKEFEQKLKSNESGLLPIDISAEYIPLSKQVQLLDNTVLEFIDKKILRFFGVSIPIVDGDYTKEQYEAFYQKTIEHIVKSFNQSFTKAIFSRRQIEGYKNKIVFYVQELIFMNTQQKLELATRLGERGSIYENEYRSWFGLRPIPELEGKRMMSLNYVDSEYAKEYQTGKPKEEEPKEEEPTEEKEPEESEVDNNDE